MAKLAAYDVNSFVLSELASVLPKENGLSPIFPIQGTPEASGFTGPYMLYTVRTAPDMSAWWSMLDEIQYVIYHQDLGTVEDIAMKLVSLFRRMDLTAQDINSWLPSKYPANDNPFVFQWFRVMGTNTPDPVTEEGGRFGRPITIRYSYITTPNGDSRIS